MSRSRSTDRIAAFLSKIGGKALSPVQAGAIAVAAVVAALLFRLAILPADGRVLFSTFYPAIAAVALLAGPGWALLSVALTLVAVHLFLMPPLFEVKLLGATDILSLTLFVLVAVVIILVLAVQQHLARELRKADQEHSALLQAAQSGIARVRAGRFEYANASMERQVGAKPGELIGRDTVFLFQSLKDCEEFRIKSRAELARSGSIDVEREFLRLDGSAYWCHLRGQGIDPDDPTVAVWVFDDTTAEHEATIAMAEAKSMAEDTARIKAEFLANMSHEIRTPMNAILGFVHILLRSAMDARQRGHLLKIRTAGQNLLAIINDILDFSKAEAGAMTLEETEFSLPELLRNTVDLVSQAAQDKGIELILDQEPDLPEFYSGDPLRLGQALLNYAGNAVKFTQRGQIILRVRKQAEDGDCCMLRFEVTDTGIGLAPEQIGKLFQSFSQVDGSTTRLHGGTGLGLVITKHIATLMGGEVGVESRLGVGSTFWFTARLQMTSREGPRYVPAPELRGIRVLLVDDNPTARSVLCDVLRSMTFEVVEQDSGAGAVASLRQAMAEGRPFDLMVIDYSLTDMDGVATLQSSRAALGERLPPCVMTTAIPQSEIDALAQSGAIAAALTKPVQASLLFDALMQIWHRPDHERREVAQEGDEALAKALRGRRALLAEDNPLNQDVAVELLGAIGMEVSIAANGQAALEKVQAGVFDLVLMDIQMPVMDGLEATRQIRALPPPLCAIPIVAMSANVRDSDRAAGFAAGVNGYLGKPIEPALLWHTIARVLHVADGATPSEAQQPAATVERATAKALPPELECLADIALLDVADGLSHAMGRAEFYLRMLHRFRTDQAKAAERIAGAATQDEALRLAHSLKGTAAQVGALTLAQAAAQAEQALLVGGKPDFGPLAAMHRSLMEDLDKALPPIPASGEAGSKAGAGTGGEEEPSKAASLSQLLGLLTAGDYRAMRLLAEERAQYQAALGPRRMEELAKCIEAFDFAAAAKIVASALDDLNPRMG